MDAALHVLAGAVLATDAMLVIALAGSCRDDPPAIPREYTSRWDAVGSSAVVVLFVVATALAILALIR